MTKIALHKIASKRINIVPSNGHKQHSRLSIRYELSFLFSVCKCQSDNDSIKIYISSQLGPTENIQ